MEGRLKAGEFQLFHPFVQCLPGKWFVTILRYKTVFYSYTSAILLQRNATKIVNLSLSSHWQAPLAMVYSPYFWRARKRVFSKQFPGPLRQGVKAIRTAGSTAEAAMSRIIDWVKSSNFISWLLHNRNAPVRRLVKRSIRVVKV